MKKNNLISINLLKGMLLPLLCSFVFLNQSQAQSLVNFNTTTDLTNLFNPDATPVFTNISNLGIGGTGSINVPIGSNDIWTTKEGYSVTGSGAVYTISAYFLISDNSGYGGLGLSPNNVNSTDGFGSPVSGLGMGFHGGGGFFVNNRVNTDVNWPPDLILGNWYKMIFKITALGSNQYNLNFQIWNSDANGVLGTMKTEQNSNGVTNTNIGTASTIHTYFSAAGSRMSKIDNFEAILSGGAVIVAAGQPVVSTNSISAITGNTATSGGNVTDDRGSAVTAKGVCWNTSSSPTIANSKTTDGTGIGAFTSSITGLSIGTLYFMQEHMQQMVLEPVMEKKEHLQQHQHHHQLLSVLPIMQNSILMVHLPSPIQQVIAQEHFLIQVIILL